MRGEAVSHGQRHKSSRYRRAAAPYRAAHGRRFFTHRSGQRNGSPRRERRNALAPCLVCRGARPRRARICPRHPRHARRRGIHERGRLRRRDERRRNVRDVSRQRPFSPRNRRCGLFLPPQPLLRHRLYRSRRKDLAARGRSQRHPRADAFARRAAEKLAAARHAVRRQHIQASRGGIRRSAYRRGRAQGLYRRRRTGERKARGLRRQPRRSEL